MDLLLYFPVSFGVGVVEGSVGIAVTDVAERTVSRLSKKSVQAENEARFGEHDTPKWPIIRPFQMIILSASLLFLP